MNMCGNFGNLVQWLELSPDMRKMEVRFFQFLQKALTNAKLYRMDDRMLCEFDL